MSYKRDYDKWLSAPYDKDYEEEEKRREKKENSDFFELDFDYYREERDFD